MTTLNQEILVLGHKGMLGSQVFSYLKKENQKVVTTEHRWPHNDFKKEIKDHKGIIINCIGAIPQAKPKDYSINFEIPLYIQSLEKKLIQPCTDCVFSGKKPIGENYSKSDPMDGSDEYAASKSHFINESHKIPFEKRKNTKVIRTSIVGIDEKSISLLSWFLYNCKQNKHCKGYINHYWNGITTLQWSKIVYDMIKNWIPSSSEDDWLLQVGGTAITKYSLLKTISHIFNTTANIEPFATERTVNKCLISDIKVPDISKQLLDFKEFHSL
jgi:dTDP-4-dehydrorhamnose reductase